jgi:hypothetical protein
MWGSMKNMWGALGGEAGAPAGGVAAVPASPTFAGVHLKQHEQGALKQQQQGKQALLGLQQHKAPAAAGKPLTQQQQQQQQPLRSKATLPIAPHAAADAGAAAWACATQAQLPQGECLAWEAALSHAARKGWKECAWKWSVKDPFVRVFAFDTLRRAGEPRWGWERGTPLPKPKPWDACAALAQLPKHECVLWEARLSHGARKPAKQAVWRDQLRDKYVRVFAFDTLRKANQDRWEVATQRDLPGWEALEWEADTTHGAKKCWKDAPWDGQAINNPYVWCFAYDALRPASEPRWQSSASSRKPAKRASRA